MFIQFAMVVIMFFGNIFSQSNFEQNIITIIGTTNVHGEIDPCG